MARIVADWGEIGRFAHIAQLDLGFAQRRNGRIGAGFRACERRFCVCAGALSFAQ